MGKKIKGFVLGAAVGSLAALMFAPKSGRELRNDLKNKSKEVKANTANNEDTTMAEDVTNQLQSQTEEIARQLRESRQVAAGDLTPAEAATQMEKEEEIVIPVSETIQDEVKAEEAVTNDEQTTSNNDAE